jgi:uncharacterized protein YgiM (DUF1202 family)
VLRRKLGQALVATVRHGHFLRLEDAADKESPVKLIPRFARIVTALVATSALLVGVAGTLPAVAADSQVTAMVGLRIRSGPSTSSAVVGGLSAGQVVTKVTAARGWTKIRFSGRSAYVASRYVGRGVRLSAPSRLPAGAKVTTTAINLRRGPALSSSVAKVLPAGTRASVSGTPTRGFIKVVAGSSRGWASTRYLAAVTGGAPGAPALPRATGTRYTTANVNVRASSKASSDIVAVVAKGSEVSITGVRANGRSQIIYGSAKRWVVTRYLTTKRPGKAPSYAVERGLTPRAVAVHRAALKRYPQIATYYGMRNDPSSDHSKGKALDLMLPGYKSAKGKALGQNVANWAVANHKSLGIQYVIWNQHIWNVSRSKEGWRFMASRGNDSANHKNHVHISVK